MGRPALLRVVDVFEQTESSDVRLVVKRASSDM